MEGNDLQERLFKFAVDVLKLLRSLKGGTDLNIISFQLGKSSTLAGIQEKFLPRFENSQIVYIFVIYFLHIL